MPVRSPYPSRSAVSHSSAAVSAVMMPFHSSVDCNWPISTFSSVMMCRKRYQGAARNAGAGPFLEKTCPSGPNAPSTSPGLLTYCVQAMVLVSTSPRRANDSVTAKRLTSSTM